MPLTDTPPVTEAQFACLALAPARHESSLRSGAGFARRISVRVRFHGCLGIFTKYFQEPDRTVNSRRRVIIPGRSRVAALTSSSNGSAKSGLHADLSPHRTATRHSRSRPPARVMTTGPHDL